jgi:hypothetical protein
MHVKRSVIVGLLFLACLPVSAQLSDQQIVDNAFPTDLRDPDFPMARRSTFVTADLNRDGDRLIVALYSDGFRGQILVFDRGGHVRSHPKLHSLKGMAGDLVLVDLDQDGVPEIIAQLYSGHQPQIPDSWVFAWRSGQLVLISPTRRVGSLDITPLSQIAEVDMDGSGKLSLLAFPGVHRNDSGKLVDDGDVQLYTFSNGKITATRTTFRYAETFYRNTSGRTKSVANFAATPGRRILRIINGTEAGNTVDSGRVTLNGVDVIRPADFKPKAHVIDISVQLAPQNHLEVDPTGKPGSGIWVMVISQ